MLLEVESSQLVLVDYQIKLMPAMKDAQAVWQRAAVMAQTAQLLQVPVWATEQNPSGLGETSPEIRKHCKRVFSAVEEGLGEWLSPAAPAVPKGNARSLPRHLQKPVEPEVGPSVVIAGCEAHICLLQTALDLLEDEFDVWVVTDACASRSERDRDAAFDRLAGAGAELLTTEMVIFEWLRSAENPDFKEVQSWVKALT
ncbi:MAG: isochorismatase family protein [Betaproteobacteria bacterium]|nr:isochorismatase family protein [Betaproteobacteria bacterium]